ncbi:MAG: tetraacyldisaccharide 4'-kinase [Rhabdochlamydiaceae bacterium]|nr:tetraacyldisaccharide 4'-kinase [Candidatus Amphrikana amoebophyrae]
MKKSHILSHTLAKKLEISTLKAIKNKERPFVLFFLYLLSLFFRFALFSRNLAYCLKIKKGKKLPTKVVSIGNITAGGTGKTPFAILLLSLISDKQKCALLSSGYRKISKKDGIINLDSSDAKDMGDEPFLIASTFPNVDVYSIKDRKPFLSNFSAGMCDVLLLDDGMQKRDIQRDLEIVCMRGSDLFGHGYFIPRGLLRDNPKRLKSAHLICVNEITDEAHFMKLCKKIKKYSSSPVVGAEMVILSATTLKGDSVVIEPGLKVGVFCATANPDSFINSIKKKNITCVGLLTGADHSKFDDNQLRDFATECQKRGVHALVCTQKDSVKLSPKLEIDLPIYVLNGQLKVTYGIRHFEHFINQISGWKS